MTFLVLFLARYDFHVGHKTGGFYFIVVLHLLTSDNLSPVVRLSLRNFCFCLVNVGHISAPKAFIDEMSLLHMCVCIQVYRKRERHTHIHTYIKTKACRHIH